MTNTVSSTHNQQDEEALHLQVKEMMNSYGQNLDRASIEVQGALDTCTSVLLWLQKSEWSNANPSDSMVAGSFSMEVNNLLQTIKSLGLHTDEFDLTAMAKHIEQNTKGYHLTADAIVTLSKNISSNITQEQTFRRDVANMIGQLNAIVSWPEKDVLRENIFADLFEKYLAPKSKEVVKYIKEEMKKVLDDNK